MNTMVIITLILYMGGRYNQIFILNIFIFIFSGCRFSPVPIVMKNNFTYCYDEKNKGVDSLISIEGYYKQGVKFEVDTKYLYKKIKHIIQKILQD